MLEGRKYILGSCLIIQLLSVNQLTSHRTKSSVDINLTIYATIYIPDFYKNSYGV